MARQFEQKVMLITGGATGIGRATAVAFAREGATVAIGDVDEPGARETCALITATGAKAVFHRTDVSCAGDVATLVKQIVTQFGRLDGAFNNAGVAASDEMVADFDEAEWNRTIDINLKGVWLCMKYELRQMLAQDGGVIVNASSIMGLVATPLNPAYIASKHGVVGLTKSAAVAYANAGIRVNAVCPGFIRSPMTDHFFSRSPELKKLAVTRHPLGRIGTPEEVAAAVLWLCSDAASFVTGHTLSVDGGYVAQ